MSVAQSFEEYKNWVNENPRIFKIGAGLYLTGEKFVEKLLQDAGTSPTYGANVQVINNAISLDGFLAWSEQVCGC